MIDTYDLLQQIKEEKLTPKFIIQEANEFIENFKEEISKYAEEKGYCHKCGEELIASSYKEYRGEYLGTPAHEIMTEYKCPNGCNLEEY